MAMETITAGWLPGLALSRALYEEGVRPVLDAVLPGLPHSAARLGTGSEVLGFDTERSADHEWGPQLQVFLAPEALAAHGAALREALAERMPRTVRGWPTRYRQGAEERIGHLAADGPAGNHRVHPVEAGAWFAAHLGVADATRPLTTAEWLSVTQQGLAGAVGGEVFHDGLGVLGPIRERLAWYPDDVWRYLLACQWTKVSQEEAFVGRTAEAGDELGSAVVAARQVRELLRLALLQARRYAPYSKWLGSAFARDVPGSAALGVLLRGVLAAERYPEREDALCAAYEELGRRQNALGLAGVAEVEAVRRPYHGRPFLVIHAERFAAALRESIADPAVRALPLTGSVDQFADSTDFLGHGAARAAAVRALLADA